jgi:hypothetical protein
MFVLTTLFAIGMIALMLKIAISLVLVVGTLFLGALSFILCPLLIFIIIGGLIFGLIIIGKLLGALARALS